MSISKEDIKKLWGRAGGQCSMPHCTESLAEDKILLGEMAHVIARSSGGPRGIIQGGEDIYENLVLLCPTHHTEVDKDPESYPTECLLRFKRQHEQWVKRCIEVPFGSDTQGHLIVFCGASSVGKDTVASRIRDYLRDKVGVICDFLDKYTTREKRSVIENPEGAPVWEGSAYEPSSRYTFLTKDAILEDTDVFFLYKKYDRHLYGFSKRHLQSKLKEDRTIACILGALDRIQDFRDAVWSLSKRKVFAILLEAERNELLRRLGSRHILSEAEKERRRPEIERDIARICMLRNKSSDLLDFFDLVVDNGEDSNLIKTVSRIGDGVAQWLKWLPLDEGK